MKLKVQFFRNTDDPYQYISDNSKLFQIRFSFPALSPFLFNIGLDLIYMEWACLETLLH